MAADGLRMAAVPAAIGLSLATMPSAIAQDAGSGRDTKMSLAPGPDPASGITNTLVDPSNGGVAGTGLGKMSPAEKDGAGTGMSVKGPAGVGVDLGRDNLKP